MPSHEPCRLNKLSRTQNAAFYTIIWRAGLFHLNRSISSVSAGDWPSSGGTRVKSEVQAAASDITTHSADPPPRSQPARVLTPASVQNVPAGCGSDHASQNGFAVAANARGMVSGWHAGHVDFGVGAALPGWWHCRNSIIPCDRPPAPEAVLATSHSNQITS